MSMKLIVKETDERGETLFQIEEDAWGVCFPDGSQEDVPVNISGCQSPTGEISISEVADNSGERYCPDDVNFPELARILAH